MCVCVYVCVRVCVCACVRARVRVRFGSHTAVVECRLEDYHDYIVLGFDVRVHSAVIHDAPLFERLMEMMKNDFAAINSTLPAASLPILHAVSIFVNAEFCYGASGACAGVDGRGMCFHVSPDWCVSCAGGYWLHETCARASVWNRSGPSTHSFHLTFPIGLGSTATFNSGLCLCACGVSSCAGFLDTGCA